MLKRFTPTATTNNVASCRTAGAVRCLGEFTDITTPFRHVTGPRVASSPDARIERQSNNTFCGAASQDIRGVRRVLALNVGSIYVTLRMVVRGHDSSAIARPLLLAACRLLFSGTSAVAQEAQSTGTDQLDFMPRYKFYILVAALAHDDPRFAWDTHFGGDVDVLAFAARTCQRSADYEAVLGSEIPRF